MPRHSDQHLSEVKNAAATLRPAQFVSRDEQTWDDLTDPERRDFWNYRILTREIEEASDADLRDLFRRLNQHTVVLNAQELRNARFKGDFIHTVTDLANQEFWAEGGIVRAGEIRRMLDIEFVAELLVGIMHGPQNKKASLDGFFQSYEDGIPKKQFWLTRFEEARAITEKLVPDLRHSRWKGRSDYYSLFIAADELNQSSELRPKKVRAAQHALKEFGEQVTLRLSKKGAGLKFAQNVRRYGFAVEKAASDKDRREARHQILVPLLRRYFF